MTELSQAPGRSIPVELFKENIRLLASEYEIVSLETLMRLLLGEVPWRERCVALTFDDSLRSMATVAAPALRELGVTATFFVSTTAIETGLPYWWDRVERIAATANSIPRSVRLDSREEIRLPDSSRTELLQWLKKELKDMSSPRRDAFVARLEESTGLNPEWDGGAHASIMNWEDVKRLLALGMDVGSHSVTHANLELLSGSELDRELSESRQTIESHLGIPCRHLAYPYGRHSEATSIAAKNAGYRLAVTTIPGWNSRRSDVHRLWRRHLPKDLYQVASMMIRDPGLVEK